MLQRLYHVLIICIHLVTAYDFALYPKPYVVPEVNATWSKIFLENKSIPLLPQRPAEGRTLMEFKLMNSH